MTGFYLKYNTGLKWSKCKVKRSALLKSTTLIIRTETSSLFLFLLPKNLNMHLLVTRTMSLKIWCYYRKQIFSNKWIIKCIRYFKQKETFLFILQSIVESNPTIVFLNWQIISLTKIKHPTLRINPKRKRKTKYYC